MKRLPLSLLSRDLFKFFVENSLDGLLVIDAEGLVRFANPAAILQFAEWTSELVGFHLGVPAIQEPLELILPRSNGIRYVEMVATEILWQGKMASLASLRDVTDRKRTELTLAETLGQFRGIVEQSIAGIYIVQDGKFVYANPRGAAIIGEVSPEFVIGTNPLSWVIEADRGKVEQFMRPLVTGETRNLAIEFGVRHQDGVVTEVGLNAAAATYRGRPALIGLLQDISEKKRAEEEVRRYVEQLKASLMSTVEVATALSEMRDPNTTGHERRVAAIAVAIGTELGLDERRLEGLRVAGHLHDIGKITIPAEILSKSGKLSAIEFALMECHSQAGYDVLKGVAFPWPVAQTVLQHHERMDGSGYPQGLKGEAILPEARIIAVADVVEAMCSHRPYRAGLGIGMALSEIERGRGSAYDADVADACLRLFRERRYQLPG